MLIKEVLLESEKELQIHFLATHSLDYEADITYAILVYDNDLLVGTASIATNVLKCFLVEDNYQSHNITTIMFQHLLDVLHQNKIYHYFVYTKPENLKIFTSLGMRKIVQTMNTVLLEGGDEIVDVLTDLKYQYNISNNPKSCVIINANPMTLGHLYLIETAAKESTELLVFVVSEDLSSFPFNDRFNIIKDATKHLKNVTVLPTLSYLVSKITFPKYFLREDQLIKDEQTLIDVLVYKEFYTKIFKINKRYLGEEPFSYNTNKYNQVLEDYLKDKVKIIKRKAYDKTPISASFVRKLIKLNHIEKIKDYVPQATYDYLKSEKGKAVIKIIQSKELGRH